MDMEDHTIVLILISLKLALLLNEMHSFGGECVHNVMELNYIPSNRSLESATLCSVQAC